MLGNGLQGTLLGLRATFEGFPIFVTGLIMALYYFGFLIGCLFVPATISKVGHVRVFAAFASTASSTILLHGMFVDPWIWAGIRVISGISFAGLFIVAESWLNSISTNKLRGQIFSIYLLVINGGLFGGQFLVNAGPLDDIGLFILISILVSLSLVPITLANKPSPHINESETLPLRKVIKNSPLSLASVFTSGFCGGSFLGIGVVYASAIGFNVSWSSFFVAIYILGSSLVPLVTGWLSDKMDRRKAVIIITAFCFFITVAIMISPYQFPLAFALGGFITSLYSIGIAYMNDQIKPEQAVSASSTLILVSGLGATIGPIVAGALMSAFGPIGFFTAPSVLLCALFFFGLYRAYVGDEIDVEDQGEFVHFPARVSPGVVQITEDD